jgi:hypothetical protein
MKDAGRKSFWNYFQTLKILMIFHGPLEFFIENITKTVKISTGRQRSRIKFSENLPFYQIPFPTLKRPSKVFALITDIFCLCLRVQVT